MAYSTRLYARSTNFAYFMYAQHKGSVKVQQINPSKRRIGKALLSIFKRFIYLALLPTSRNLTIVWMVMFIPQVGYDNRRRRTYCNVPGAPLPKVYKKNVG